MGMWDTLDAAGTVLGGTVRVLTKILKPCNNSLSVRCGLHSTIVWVIIAGSKVPFPRMCLWARFQADPRSTSYFVQGCAVSQWPVEDSEL